jgi:hypothetical protein
MRALRFDRGPGGADEIPVASELVRSLPLYVAAPLVAAEQIQRVVIVRKLRTAAGPID